MSKALLISLTTAIVLSSFYLVTFTSCKKDYRCYSRALENEYKNKVCPLDCPGVIGCNGKKYCNECLAAKQGITAL